MSIATTWLLVSSSAVTFEELRNAPNLTPQKFASYFSDFEFRFHAEIQPIDLFLETKSGDCDDYAILAATVLKEKGYTPRLVTVRMPGVVHVVCYIEETHSYLDYNARQYLSRTISSGPTVSEIAAKVAASYSLAWTSASEFTYGDGLKRLVATELPAKKDPSASKRQFASLLGFKN